MRPRFHKRVLTFTAFVFLTSAGPVLAQRPAVLAPGADVPVEVALYRANLVAVVKVVEIERARDVVLLLPGQLEPSQRLVEKARVEVVRVLRETAPTTAATTGPASQPREDRAAPPRRIEVLVPAAASPLLPEHSTPLEAGKKYILALCKLRKQSAYFLPDSPAVRAGHRGPA